MPRETENEVLDRFRSWYARGDRSALDDVERAVIGSDFGANGYTTRAQADRLAARVGVAPGARVLDVGAGAGWPSVYLAVRTGWSIVTTDLPLEGLHRARARAASEGVASRVHAVCARAEALPFRPASLDAIVHTDVLC